MPELVSIGTRAAGLRSGVTQPDRKEAAMKSLVTDELWNRIEPDGRHNPCSFCGIRQSREELSKTQMNLANALESLGRVDEIQLT
jgi:hypothetical protein